MQNTNQENSIQICRWHQFDSQDGINHAIIDQIQKLASHALATQGVFRIVLAGGSTPKQIYAQLKNLDTDWSKWHIYHNDDRCLPVDHPERNSKMARDVWLSHVSIPESQIHDIPAELGNVEGAKEYAQTLLGVPDFDLVLLGLGEDAHTASLFPGHAVDNSADAVPVFNSPKPPADRVTMSAKRLNRTKAVIFMVTGPNKQAAVNQWRNEEDIPARLICPANGVDIYCFGVKL
jgi:6-phosphogluconolactonase